MLEPVALSAVLVVPGFALSVLKSSPTACRLFSSRRRRPLHFRGFLPHYQPPRGISCAVRWRVALVWELPPCASPPPSPCSPGGNSTTAPPWTPSATPSPPSPTSHCSTACRPPAAATT